MRLIGEFGDMARLRAGKTAHCSGKGPRRPPGNRKPAAFPRVLVHRWRGGLRQTGLLHDFGREVVGLGFSMPSPTARRTNRSTSAPPAAFSACLDGLVGVEHVRLAGQRDFVDDLVDLAADDLLEDLGRLACILSTSGRARFPSPSRRNRPARAAAEMYGGFIAATCIARPRASSAEPPLTSTSTPMRPPCT